MLVELQMVEEKRIQYNEHLLGLKKEYPDMAEYFCPIKSLDEVFLPYAKKDKYCDWSEYKCIQEDYRKPEEFKGIYIADLNDNHSIEYLTEYREARTHSNSSPIYWYDYGVADNASQVLDYFDDLVNKYGDYMNDRSFVILMVPFFKQYDKDWRWCKWGKYIGKHEPEYEYLCAEENIDYIYTFHIYELEKIQDNEQ